MKKNLLIGLFALLMSGQAMADSQLCRPFLEWGFYACISKVEINGMTSTFSTTPDGWEGEIGKNSYDEATQYGDLTSDATKKISLEAGKKYDLKVTICNFSSGEGDLYYLTVLFDWDNDYTLTKAETIHQETLTLKAPGQNSFIAKNIEVDVPSNVTGTCTMRIYLHYKTPAVPYDQNDPCCDQDGGMLKDYQVAFGSESSIVSTSIGDFSVYPNPTDGILNINAEDASQYMLYSVDGKLVQKGIVEGNSINVAGNQPGMYILKVQSGDAVKQTNIIIK